MNWFGYAALSAIAAAATAILAKVGVKDVNSNLATAIRTVVVLVFAWGIVLAAGEQRSITKISRYSMTFLVLSGLATGLSWLFYFRALQLGRASQVAPVDKFSVVLTVVFAAVFLGESMNWGIALGAALITVGLVVVSIS
jgi:transporter family protein